MNRKRFSIPRTSRAVPVHPPTSRPIHKLCVSQYTQLTRPEREEDYDSQDDDGRDPARIANLKLHVFAKR
jgi:hypothetical protein